MITPVSGRNLAAKDFTDTSLANVVAAYETWRKALSEERIVSVQYQADGTNHNIVVWYVE